MKVFRFFPIVIFTLNIWAQNFPPTELPPIEERDMQTNQLYVQAGAPHALPDVTFSIHYGTTLLKSNLTFGITHTHYRWQDGNAAAIEKAKALMSSFGYFHNTHIMTLGGGMIRTDANGIPTNLDNQGDPGLDAAIYKVTGLGEGMITFFSAPYWMLEAGRGDGNPDVDHNLSAGQSAVRKQFEDAYARLCAEIAKRYDGTKGFPKITYFQVWSEMKGMYDNTLKRWDYERYTRFYNKIYNAVKAVRPDVLMGGFYQVIPGDGSNPILGKTGQDTNYPIDTNTKFGIDYFLKNAERVDFFCVDKNTISFHNPNKGYFTDTEAMKLTPVWGKLMEELEIEFAKHPQYKNIPILFSEYYPTLEGNEQEAQRLPLTPPIRNLVTGGATIEQYTAAQHASVYNHVIRGSSGHETWMNLWLEAENGIPMNSFITPTNTSGGGEPKLLYWVMKAYKDWFNHTILVKADSNSEDVEVIASFEAAMVINKRNKEVKVNINDKGISLPAYGVALLELPAQTFEVTVSSEGAGATGNKYYAPGATVVINAGTPPEGKYFKNWTASPSVTFADPNSSISAFTMPEYAVTVTAHFGEPITGVEENFVPNLKIYPNPFTDMFHITGAERCTLRVINAVGAVVHVQKIDSHDQTIQLKYLPAGGYSFRVENGGQSKTLKIVKNEK